MADAPHPPAAEGRDEQVAAQLAVPPLDDLTRRRLVATALAGRGRDRRRAWLIAAAGVAAVAVVAVILVVAAGNGGGPAPQAARGIAAPSSSEPRLPGLPDFGYLRDPGVQARVRASRAAAAARSSGFSAASGSVNGPSALGLEPTTTTGSPATRCLRAGDVPVGTGRWGERAAIVAVTTSGLAAIETTSCAVHPF